MRGPGRRRLLPLRLLLLGGTLALACDPAPPAPASGPRVEWAVHAGDRGGRRYSPLDEITPANVSRLEPVWEFHTGDRYDPAFGKRNLGVPLSPWGISRNPPPWGALTALDLERREVRWRVTLGTTGDLAPLGIALPWGTPNMGGTIVTAGGLAFVGAAMDLRVRAFDLRDGAELWSAALPAGGQATPMTYRVRAGGPPLARPGHSPFHPGIG